MSKKMNMSEERAKAAALAALASLVAAQEAYEAVQAAVQGEKMNKKKYRDSMKSENI